MDAPGSWSTHWLCIVALVVALVDIDRLSKLNSDQQASTHWEPIRKEAPDSCYFPQQVDKYAPGSWSTHWLCIAALVAALVDKSIG